MRFFLNFYIFDVFISFPTELISNKYVDYPNGVITKEFENINKKNSENIYVLGNIDTTIIPKEYKKNIRGFIVSDKDLNENKKYETLVLNDLLYMALYRNYENINNYEVKFEKRVFLNYLLYFIFMLFRPSKLLIIFFTAFLTIFAIPYIHNIFFIDFLLKPFPFEKLPSNECSICLEDYKREDKICILKCKHVYHKLCVKNWLKKVLICPLCKKYQYYH